MKEAIDNVIICACERILEELEENRTLKANCELINALASLTTARALLEEKMPTPLQK